MVASNSNLTNLRDEPEGIAGPPSLHGIRAVPGFGEIGMLAPTMTAMRRAVPASPKIAQPSRFNFGSGLSRHVLFDQGEELGTGARVFA